MPGEIKRSNEVGSWQASMRAALFDGVTEGDVTEIVQSVVKKAKAGDIKAADFLFRWTIGQQATVAIDARQIVVNQALPERAIDVLGRQPNDPTPDEIASKTLKMRHDHLEATRDRKKG
jgi:streptomycin 6-kinase